jgi:hypothetical protein
VPEISGNALPLLQARTKTYSGDRCLAHKSLELLMMTALFGDGVVEGMSVHLCISSIFPALSGRSTKCLAKLA